MLLLTSIEATRKEEEGEVGGVSVRGCGGGYCFYIRETERERRKIKKTIHTVTFFYK